MSLVGVRVDEGNKKGRRVNYRKYVNTSDISFSRLFDDLLAMGWGSSSRQFLASLRWQGRKYFKLVKCQTLVVGGRFDSIYPQRVTKQVAELLVKREVRFIDSNHIAIINSPKKVYDTITEFLR